MGNVIESFASGIGNAVGKLISSPVDFLSGKSCSSACGPTWDLMCYIENFCIAHLMKLALVFILLYIVVLFFYISYKLGICTCIGWTICRSIWACCSCWFHLWEYCCTFLRVKLRNLKRRRRLMKRERFYFHNTGEQDYSSDTSLSCYYGVGPREVNRSFSWRRKNYKSSHLRNSLRPRNHRARLSYKYEKRKNRIGENLHDRSIKAIRHGNHNSTIRDLKVVRTSKFVNKGLNNRRRGPQRHK